MGGVLKRRQTRGGPASSARPPSARNVLGVKNFRRSGRFLVVVFSVVEEFRGCIRFNFFFNAKQGQVVQAVSNV